MPLFTLLRRMGGVEV